MRNSGKSNSTPWYIHQALIVNFDSLGGTLNPPSDTLCSGTFLSDHFREQAMCSGGDPLFPEQRSRVFHMTSSPMLFQVGNWPGEVSQYIKKCAWYFYLLHIS